MADIISEKRGEKGQTMFMIFATHTQLQQKVMLAP